MIPYGLTEKLSRRQPTDFQYRRALPPLCSNDWLGHSVTSEKTLTPFNINNYVRVKLTPHGHAIVRERFRKLTAMMPVTADRKFSPPKEDAEGWSKWQLWSLMETFGEHIHLGGRCPFDTLIQLETEA